MRMRAKYKKGIPGNAQQFECAVNSLWKLNWSYREARGQEHFMLSYRPFSCYNHGEYLSHSREILVDQIKNTKMALSLPHIFAFSCLSRGNWALM